VKGTGVPWVQHYSDPFVDLTYRRYHPVSRLIDTRWERRLLNSAHRATVTSPETRDLLVARYGDYLPDVGTRIAVVPNVYDADLFTAARAHYGDQVVLPRDGAIHAAYLGHFYGRRSIQPLCRWIDWRRGQKGRQWLHIDVFGSLRASERRLVTEQYRDAITLHAPVSYLHSLAIMAATDLLLVVDAPSEGAAVHFPSKLADYLGAGRPIAAFTPLSSATARIASETGHTVISLDPSTSAFERLEAALSRAGESCVPPIAYANTAANLAPLLAP
jgi:hypothetical protein